MNKLETHIMTTIAELKADGIVAMSIDNLKQVTPTRGLIIHRAIYNQRFPEIAAKIADAMNFTILQDGERYGIT